MLKNNFRNYIKREFHPMNRIIASLVVFIILIFSLSIWVPHTIANENSWTTMEPMPTARSGIGIAVVEGKIYAIGGSYDSFGETEEYNPSTNTWTAKTPMPTPRINFGLVVVENKIYTIGGDSGNWTSGQTPTDIVEVYDPLTDTWKTKNAMNIKRIGLSASVVDGKIYVIGGGVGEPALGKVSATEVYDPLTDTWTTAKQIPTAVNYHASAVVDNKIYILGGAVGLSLNQIYDTETDTWSAGASLPVGVDGAAAGVIADDTGTQKIYVVGGKQNLDAVNLTQVYDPETDTWITGSPMPTARYGLGVAIINNTLYAIGGREGWFGSPVSAANERYIPIPPTATPALSPTSSPNPALSASPSLSPSNQPTQSSEPLTDHAPPIDAYLIVAIIGVVVILTIVIGVIKRGKRSRGGRF